MFEYTDPALWAMAKSELRHAGIRYVAQFELLQDLVGWGRMFSGYNPVTGPPRIRVKPEDAAQARDLLRDYADHQLGGDL